VQEGVSEGVKIMVLMQPGHLAAEQKPLTVVTAVQV